jgi:hypothetical protein
VGFRARASFGLTVSLSGRTRPARITLRFLNTGFRMPPSGAMRETRDAQTSLEPILVALEHIETRGSLLSFTHDHAQRVRLMKVMTEIELVSWNAGAKKYELTAFGCQCLAAHRGTTDLHVTQ